MKLKLKYEGPLKGRMRCLFDRKHVKERYEYMLNYLADRMNGGDTLEEAVDWVNWDCAGDDSGMYLFTIKEGRFTIVAFAFVDMGMKDMGYYEKVS